MASRRKTLTFESTIEQEIMSAVLRELRMAMKAKRSVSIMIDPFCDGTLGAYVFASSDPAGRRYTIERKR